MYVLYKTNYYTAKIRTYDLTTQFVVGEKTVYCNVNYDPAETSLDLGSQTNKLFFKYYIYFNSQGNYFYRKTFANYNIINHIPTDSAVISHPLLIQDSIYNNNFGYIKLSPDGKYLSCNDKGDILSLSDNSLHNLQSGTNFHPQVLYSNSGNYLMGKPNNNGAVSLNLIDVFSLPNFNLVTSIKSPNPTLSQSSSSFLKDDFLDNDSLVSYNLKHTFLNNQTKSVLTVFIKQFN